MKEFIYVSRKTGEIVDEHYPNTECYIRMDYAKVLRNAEDVAESIKEINNTISKENDRLKDLVRVQKTIIEKLKNGEPCDR